MEEGNKEMKEVIGKDIGRETVCEQGPILPTKNNQDSRASTGLRRLGTRVSLSKKSYMCACLGF